MYLEDCLYDDDCTKCYDVAVRCQQCTVCGLPLLEWNPDYIASKCNRHRPCQQRFSYLRHRYYQRLRYRHGVVSVEQRESITQRALTETQEDESVQAAVKLYLSSELGRYHRDGHGPRW